MATKHKNHKSRKATNRSKRKLYQRPKASASRADFTYGEITEHHAMMYATMIDLVEQEGIEFPASQPMLGVHPTEDEVFMFFSGATSKELFNRVIVQSWNDCTFVVGFVPEIQAVFNESGVLAITRRFVKRPTDAEVTEFVTSQWGGFVGFA